MNNQRRVFLITAAGTGAALSLGAHAQAKMVDEKDKQAIALGYVADASRADAKKFPKFAAGQNCTNCALYQGKPGSTSGGCPIFGANQVAAKGWCSGWVKKA